MNTDIKSIIIIGASSGLGREIARIYARRGLRVGICARREAELKQLASEFPQNMVWKTLDVTAVDSGKRLEEFDSELGGADCVLYAAGCGWNNPGLDEEKDRRTLMTNVVGFTQIANAAFETFARSGRRGHLCVITSIAGTKGIGISSTYSASKRYQNTYLESLAQLARVRGIRIDITDIRPGFIDTALLDTEAHTYPMLMQPEYAARRIVRAIDRRRKVAYIDWRWHIVTALWRLIPRTVWTRLKLSI